MVSRVKNPLSLLFGQIEICQLLAIRIFENHWNSIGPTWNTNYPTRSNTFYIDDSQHVPLEYTEILGHFWEFLNIPIDSNWNIWEPSKWKSTSVYFNLPSLEWFIQTLLLEAGSFDLNQKENTSFFFFFSKQFKCACQLLAIKTFKLFTKKKRKRKKTQHVPNLVSQWSPCKYTDMGPVW